MNIDHKAVVPSDESEISLRLEGHDDIFSDFDIRPYAKRALSVDFLDEIKRAAHDKDDGGIELALLVPEQQRNESREATIRERLMAHFRRHHDLLLKEKKRVRTGGFGMVLMGVLCMVGATFIVFRDPSESLFLSFLVTFLEPAAWFLLWEGMDQVIFTARSMNEDIGFYRKMSDSRGRIRFVSY